MATILITGGTGMVGRHLTKALLDQHHRVIILTREKNKAADKSGLTYAYWNVEKAEIDAAAISSADHIIHLAGAGVADKRWTAKRKAEIRNSRVLSGQLLVDSLRRIPNKVQSLVSASAIGWYGPDPFLPNPIPFTEKFPAATDFLGTTCRLWEESIYSLDALNIRRVHIRIGIVLSRQGGMLKELLKPLSFGLATVLGSGKQMISWIHIRDLVNIFLQAIERADMKGAYNAVAPVPATGKDFVQWMATTRRKPHLRIRVPAAALKIMLGEMSVEILKSCTVSASGMLSTGYQFEFPALKDMKSIPD